MCGCVGCSLQAARKGFGARSVCSASVFGKGVGVLLLSGSFAPNNSFKPTPFRGFVETCCGARNTWPSLPRSARLNSGVRRLKRSAFLLRSLQFYRLRLQCSSACFSARCSSGAVLCALRLGLRDGAMACAGVRAAHFRLRRKCLGRARCVRLRFSARAPGRCCSRVPLRLTIRSNRRRFLASLKLPAVRAILVLHCCGRRGLTQALGA